MIRAQQGIATGWLYLIGIVALIGALTWIYGAIESSGYDRGMAECARRAQEQRDAEARQSAAASTSLEEKNAKAKVVYRTVTRTVDRLVDRPVYRNVCLDDDGLRAANAALSGALAAAGEPDGAVSKPDAARAGDGRGSAAENR